MNLFSLLKELSHPSLQKRNAAEEALRKYITESDFYLNTRKQKAFLRKLVQIDSPSARKIYEAHNQKSKLDYEEELLSYVRESRIEQKEFYEAKEFYLAVNNCFGEVNIVVDCCAGNGLGGIIFALEGKARRVILIDKKENSNYQKLVDYTRSVISPIISSTRPLNLDYYTLDIRKQTIPQGDLNISIHPCNTLTDEIIDQSIANNVPFALMPCCHSDCRYMGDNILEYFENKNDAIDLLRVKYVLEKKYKVRLRNIDSKITLKNRIIIGIPETD